MTKPVAVITGASSGLGYELALVLAKRGFDLVLGSRNSAKLKELQKELEPNVRIATVTMDVRKPADNAKLINTAIKKFARIDLLIPNAGIWIKAPIEKAKPADLKNVIETNLLGYLYCAHFAVPVMKKQRSGRIVFIGSSAAVSYRGGFPAYSASKAGIVGLAGSLRDELKDTGIMVSVFSPGGTKTDLYHHFPEVPVDTYMDCEFVAQKIADHAQNSNAEWHEILRRPAT